MRVTNFTFYSENPYSRLMYSALQGRYDPERGTVDDALALLAAGESNLLHVNWEEHAVRGSASEVEAELLVDHFLLRLRQFRSQGGRVLWTVHNEMPHELEHVSAFLRLRRELAGLVDRIIVHSTHAAAVLRHQVPRLDASLLFYLPHPSFLGCYEAEPPVDWEVPNPRTVIAFGKVRSYKGYGMLLKAIADADSSDLRIRVVGQPVLGDPFANSLIAEFGSNPRIELDFRRVPDEEVAGLLRRHACLVLPYERFLTSGVALLGMTFGVPIVAPDTPQLREVLPRAGHELLFDRLAPPDLLRALERAVSLSEPEQREVRAAYLDRARYLEPAAISKRLGELLDTIQVPQSNRCAAEV